MNKMYFSGGDFLFSHNSYDVDLFNHVHYFCPV